MSGEPSISSDLRHFSARVRHLRLLVLGDAMLDRYTSGRCDRVSPEAPVIVLSDRQHEVRLGGAASVAILTRGLGARVTLAAVVGDDADGRTIRRLLDEAGIDQAGVLVDSSRCTTCKERFLGRATGRHAQQVLRVDHETTTPITDHLARRWHAQFDDWLTDADAVLIADYGKGVCRADLLRKVIDVAGERDIPVLVDPTRIADYDRYRGATLIKANRLEAGLVAGRAIASPADAICAAGELRARYACRAAVITLDQDGLAWSQGSQSRHVPGRVRDVYDITGAGDTVLSLLGLGLAGGITLATCATWANAAAGLQVERWGVTPVTWAEVSRELARQHRSGGSVLKLAELENHLRHVRRKGRSVVLTNGCFDLLHMGHVSYLQEAATLGDVLVVAVNSDDSVRRLKGPGRPVVPERERAAMLAALACVDYAVVFPDDTPHRLLQTLQPDVLVKGGTYTVKEVVGREVVEAYGGQVCVLGLREGASTTSLVKRIRGAACS